MDGQEHKLDAVPDTGAQVSVAGESLLRQLDISPRSLLPPPPRRLKSAQNGRIICRGMLPIRLQLGTAVLHEKVLVCVGVEKPLLSWRACIALRIVPPNFPDQMPAAAPEGDNTHVEVNAVSPAWTSSATRSRCHRWPVSP